MENDIEGLLQRAFIVDKAEHATAAIQHARSKLTRERRVGAIDFEVVVPEISLDERWLRERVLRPLIYYCQSVGLTLPQAPGVFLSFFANDNVYCVLASDVLAWALDQLHEDEEDLVERLYGLPESESPASRS